MDDPRWLLMLVGFIFAVLFTVILLLDKSEKEYEAWKKQVGIDKTPKKEE